MLDHPADYTWRAAGPDDVVPDPLHGTWGGGLPPHPRVIRLLPDYGRTWPLWESAVDDWDPGYTMTPEDYGLSPTLAERLASWQAEWVDDVSGLHVKPDPQTDARWVAKGAELARLLADEVREFAVVDYRP